MKRAWLKLVCWLHGHELERARLRSSYDQFELAMYCMAWCECSRCGKVLYCAAPILPQTGEQVRGQLKAKVMARHGQGVLGGLLKPIK